MQLLRNRSAGFTLIELSIILVIIGIIISIAVVTFNLRDSAKIRNIIAKSDQYLTAIELFKDKYNYMPGDIPTSPFDGTASGNGNGKVDSVSERDDLWQHLNFGEFIDDFIDISAPGIRTPGIHRPAFMNDGAGWTYIDNVTVSNRYIDNFLRLGKVDPSGSNGGEQFEIGAITPLEARQIDAKIDSIDTPLSGRFFAYSLNTPSCIDYSGASPIYSANQNAACIANFRLLPQINSDENNVGAVFIPGDCATNPSSCMPIN